MSFLQNSYPGSFRGASFFLDSNTTNSGRKKILHEFPSTDVRFIEDLGKYKRVFDLRAFTYGTGSDYTLNRDSLSLQLDNKAAGILIHPFYGALLVTPLEYTIEEAFNEVNIANFKIQFAEGDLNLSASKLLGSATEILSQVNSGITAVNGGISSIYHVSLQYPNNYTDAFNKLTNIGSSTQNAVNSVNVAENYINAFNSQLITYNSELNNMTVDTNDLNTQLDDLFSAANNAGQTNKDSFDLFKKLFDFGGDDITITKFDTVQYSERLTNRGILNDSVRCLALLYCYENAALLTYTTTQQIEEITQILNDQFNSVYSSLYLNTETLAILAQVRVTMFQFLKQAGLNAYNLTSVYTNTIPATVLAYQFYGNLDNVNELITINNLLNVTFISGDIDILTQ